jgi:hypothetical protein
MFVCFTQLLRLLPSLASQKLVLRGNTSRASNSQKPSYFKESTLNSYAWHFEPFQVNFHVLPLKPSNTSHFVTLFLAHEDVVVGFVIFHTKLSTPRLACFICSSLILQESWSDHYNFKKKRKRKKGTPPWYENVDRNPRIRLAMVCESKGGEE